MLPSHHSEGYASDRSDPSEESWLVREKVPVVGRGRARSLGHLYEPWNWDGSESDGFGEGTQCKREKPAALKTCAQERNHAASKLHPAPRIPASEANQMISGQAWRSYLDCSLTITLHTD